MKPLIRSVAIRAKCLDCSDWQSTEVRECTVTICPLWPWRMGKQPSAESLKAIENISREEVYQTGKKN